MPKYNYNKTVIYQVTCPTFDGVYVNHTCNIRDRKYCYTHPMRVKQNKFYNTIVEHGGFDNWNMIILEEFTDCKNVDEAKEKVIEWINKLTPSQLPLNPSHSTSHTHSISLSNPLNNSHSTSKYKTCKHCGKKFTRTDNLTRHLSQTCKHQNNDLLEKENETLREALAKKDEQFAKTIEAIKQEFKNELNAILHKQTKKSPNKIKQINNMLQNNSNNTNNTNNNQINNITIIELGKERLSDFLSPKQQKQILDKKYKCLDYLINTIHFNPKYRQFQNIYITNIHDPFAYQYVEEERRFITIQKDDLLTKLFDYRMEDISDFYENCKGTMLEQKTKKAVGDFIQSMGDDKKALEKQKDMRLIVYNGSRSGGTQVTMPPPRSCIECPSHRDVGDVGKDPLSFHISFT